MQIDYTQHALIRMNERHITPAEVEQTLLYPYDQAVSHSSGNVIYFGRPSGRQITVVVVPGSNPPRVVTVWD